MARFYHTRRIASVVTATTSAAGYPAANVLTQSVLQPWRASGAGATDFVIEFPTASAFAALMLVGVNFASCAVQKSADGVVFSSAGTFQSFPDPKIPSYRRGLVVISDPALKAIKLQIAAGTPTSGLAWAIGAVHAFQTGVVLPLAPDYGVQVRARWPSLRIALPNGRNSVAETGAPFNEIVLPFERSYDESLEELLRYSRAGIVGLALEADNYTEMVWPVRHQEEQIEEAHPFFNFSTMQVELQEVV